MQRREMQQLADTFNRVLSVITFVTSGLFSMVDMLV